MKQYPKLYEDIYKETVTNLRTEKITSTFGSPEALANKFRSACWEAHMQLFSIITKQVWLEQQFMYGEERREKRTANGYTADWAWSYFMKNYVGISQKAVTLNPVFFPVATYMKDFFPDFLLHDPLEEPEYFKFPFKNLSLDHLTFVYQLVDMRMDMLQYAEENNMTIGEFMNWATNHVLCCNNDHGEDAYELNMGINSWAYIQDTRFKNNFWSNDLFKFKQ